MKIMKTIKLAIIGAATLLLVSTVQTFAIEGLKVSVQFSNVTLSWPSTNDETYIVQYRPTLNTNSAWTTMTNSFPPASGTNVTSFTGNRGSTNTGFYRVVRDGVHLFGLTNGAVLSSVVEVPIEMSLSSTDQIAGLSFYANGSPLIGAMEKNGGSPWVMEWDTAMVTNGTYAISAGVDFAGDDSITNLPVTVTVSNVISFPNYFTRFFGNQMWIYAELATLQADYEIAMYVDETNYIGSFTGSTSDGVISFIWDLTDGGSYTFTNETFRGEFHITPTANGASGPSPADGPSSTQSGTNLWAKESVWPGEGNFVIAWSRPDTIPQNSIKANSMVASGVVDLLGNAYTLSPGNPQYSDTAFQMYNSYTKADLLNYLSDINFRNFYFFGHGSPYSIGGISGDPTIGYKEISHRLFNFFLTRKPINYHPYRFVFIDGCDAGKAGFCEAFGIPAQTLSRAFFTAAGVRSRAFLGFKGNATFNPAQWEFRKNMLANFFTDWVLNNLTLQDCVNNAVNFTQQPMDSSWVIYGATNLQRGLP